MEFIYINKIISKKIKIGKYSAFVDKNIYFNSENRIFYLTRDQLLSSSTTIDDATLLEQLDGTLCGMISFNNKLIILLHKEEKKILYAYNKKWINIFSILNSHINTYIITEDNNYLIFFDKTKEGFGIIYTIDKNLAVKKIFEFKNKFEYMHTFFQKGNFLYFSVGNSPYKILKLKIYDDTGNLLKNIGEEVETNIDIKAYKFFDINNQFYYCPDGLTQILDLSSNKVFEDIENFKSGFQISALGILKSPSLIFLGTWRRNKEHPYACFYILKDFKVVFKDIDEIEVDKDLVWTGYELHNNSLKVDSNYFIPCYRSNAFFITKLNTEEIENIHNQSIKILYTDNDSIIIKNINENKNIESNFDIRKPYFIQPPKNKTIVHLTFDIEQHVKGVPYCITGEGLPRKCGTYWIMDMLDKYGFKGTFFVNIYEHVNFENGLIEKLVKDIDIRGHEIGLHVHSSDLKFNKKILTSYSKEEQKKIILYGINFIKKITNKAPVSFRAGGYVINQDTFNVLNDLGIQIDSSLFMASLQNDVIYKTKNRPEYYNNVLEIPITTHAIYEQLSKIDINWIGSSKKLIEIIKTCRNQNLNHLVFMGHSFSFLKFTKDKNFSKYNFLFTGNRYLSGINEQLMYEFESFLKDIKTLNKDFSIYTFSELLKEENSFILKNISNGLDRVPFKPKLNNFNNFCPICNSPVKFQPYRKRKNALCPNCKSLERIRFKYLYLKRKLNIENIENLKILHIGPNVWISNWLKNLDNIDYISADPYNEAYLNFKVENIPFEDNHFDLVICIGVLMHVLDDHKAIESIYKKLKPGGELLLWIGNLDNETTIEYYKRADFSKMIVGETTIPEDLHHPIIREKNNKIYYNPRYATRKYGKDFLTFLSKKGYICNIISASDFLLYPDFYGIDSSDVLISCKKNIFYFLKSSINIPCALKFDDNNFNKGKMLIENKRLQLAGYSSIDTVNWKIWEKDPFIDNSWIWELHCFNFLIDILAYYDKDHKERALITAKEAIESWMNNYSTYTQGDPSIAWHDHGTAIRLENFIKFLFYISKNSHCWVEKNIDFINKFINVCIYHANILSKENFYSKFTNHGLIQSYILLLVSFSFSGINSSKKWQQIAINRIISEFKFAFTDEGVHIENSPGYHFFMAKTFLLIIEYFPNIKNLNEEFNLISDKILDFLLRIIRPDNKLPIIGDTELCSISNPFYNHYSSKNIYQNYLYIHTKGTTGIPPERLHAVYPKSGYAIFRSSWNLKKDYSDVLHIVIKAGCKARYHHQKDEGNIVLYAFKEDWLIDSGMYNYNENTPIRKYMRSRQAHNIPLISNSFYNTDFNHRLKSWKITRWDICNDKPYVMIDINVLVNIHQKRSLFYNKILKRIVIIDSFYMTDNIKREIKILWHFPMDKKISIKNNRTIEITSKSNNKLTIDINHPAEISIFQGEKNNRIYSYVSWKKNTYEDSQVIVLNFGYHEKISIKSKFTFK